jgi:hypothetical protein
MPYDRFLIANYSDGLRTDLKPWIIPDEAFEKLTNAYVFRGRVRKRWGSVYMGLGDADSSNLNQLFSRFRINVGMTSGSGAATGTVPSGMGALGQMFSIGDEIYTVYISTPGAQPMLDTGFSTTATFDISNGDFVFAGAPLSDIIYWYPALPVMGLDNYEVGAINNQPLYGFDTRFAYKFSATSGWQRSFSGSAPFNPIFQGTDLNFFWTTNWRGTTADVTILFVTNFNSAAGVPPVNQDPLWSYDGTLWTIFIPYFLPAGGAPLSGPYVQTSLIILPFKNRLLLLNTIEYNGTTNQAFVNRCRYSFVGSPFAVNAWYERGQTDSSGNVAGGAGFIDATTEEAIVSAEFIKDRLIVYFDRSTWELVYTGNQVEPFVWQKINTELGSESLHSTVPFDKFVVTIGNTGVHACSGANVERIDNKIPDEIFEAQDEDSQNERICGIRDYFSELVYWAYPNDSDTGTYPNSILIYNYKNDTWANFDDSVTAWGYYEQQTDTTWLSAPDPWEQSNYSWVSGIIQANFRQVVAGNQEGYTFIVQRDTSRNAGVLQITNMTSATEGYELIIINHNLTAGDFIYMENVQGFSDFVPIIVEVVTRVDSNDVIVSTNIVFTGDYAGGGTAARVSNIEILTKQFNPYINKASDFYLAKVDFAVESTDSGQITVDYYPSSTTLSMIGEGIANNSIMGTGVLETSPYNPLYYPLEQQQQLLWHSVYFQSSGEFIQLYLYMSDDQLVDPDISLEDFQLEGMILYTERTGRLE